jgi:hypothetical protein
MQLELVKLICLWTYTNIEQRLEPEAICDKELKQIKWPMELNFMGVWMECFFPITVLWSVFSDQASVLPVLSILSMCILVIRSKSMVFMGRI